MSELWTEKFSTSKRQASILTAYHLQSDGQSQRFNQTIEIAPGSLSLPLGIRRIGA